MRGGLLPPPRAEPVAAQDWTYYHGVQHVRFDGILQGVLARRHPAMLERHPALRAAGAAAGPNRHGLWCSNHSM